MLISYVSTRKKISKNQYTHNWEIENVSTFPEDSCNAVEVILKPDHSAAGVVDFFRVRGYVQVAPDVFDTTYVLPIIGIFKDIEGR